MPETKNTKKTRQIDVGSVLRKAKNFIHPANVTWKSPKSTTHDSAVVLGVVIASAIILAAGDGLFGLIMNMLF